MTKKDRFVAAGLLASIVFTALVVWAILPKPGVTKANMDRIQEGMTKSDVEEIFGLRGEVMPNESKAEIRRQQELGLSRSICWCEKHPFEAFILVRFNTDGRVGEISHGVYSRGSFFKRFVVDLSLGWTGL